MGLLGLLTTLMWLGLSTGQAQTLSVEGQRGEVGETVAFTVWIHEAPNNVGAFSFDVTYDPQVLTYKNKIGQELLDHFVFDAVGRGDRVQVAGFSAGEIAAGSSGRLVTLEFEVRTPEATTLAIHNLLDQVAGWSVQPGLFEPVVPLSDADPREEQTTQPSQEQREKGSPEPSLTLAEQMDRQVHLLLSQPGQLPSAPSAITSSPAMQTHSIGRSTQTTSRSGASQPETAQAHESGQVMSGRKPARPLADGNASRTPSTSVPIPPPQNGTTSADTPTVESTGQHRSTMGDSPTLPVTAKLISPQPGVPLQQSTSEHVAMIPGNAQAAKRGAASSPVGAQQAGFLSPTLRIVILLCAITLLCLIGAVLINLKKQ